MKSRDTNVQVNEKNLSHILLHLSHNLHMHFILIFSEYITIASSEVALIVWEYNFFLGMYMEGIVACNLHVQLLFIQVNFLHAELRHNVLLRFLLGTDFIK